MIWAAMGSTKAPSRLRLEPSVEARRVTSLAKAWVE
jgi:hypothetical protein